MREYNRMNIQKFIDESTHKVMGIDMLDKQMFAELIVHECIDALQDLSTQEGDDYDNAITEAILTIKERFFYTELESNG